MLTHCSFYDYSSGCLGREAVAVQAHVAAAAAARSKLVVDTTQGEMLARFRTFSPEQLLLTRRDADVVLPGEERGSRRRKRGLTRLRLASSPFFSIAARATRQTSFL